MIISPPFLRDRNVSQSDADWVNAMMPVNSLRGFPLNEADSWHGGIHITHTDTGASPEKIRAIADGVVVSFRKPSASKNAEPLNYRGATDDGYVLLKHETEIGSGEDGKVVFYSLYMHMKFLEAEINQDAKIYRKAPLGSSGMCSGQNEFHLQIFCDDDNISKLTGRITRELDISHDGRTDAVYGDIHFYLPAGTIFYAKAPSNHTSSTDGLSSVHTSAVPLYVSMTLHKGNCTMVTRQENSGTKGKFEFVGEALVNADGEEYEYNLYKTAMANYQQSPSAGFELLRFGRVINTEHETLVPADAPLWMTVNYPGGKGVVNLAAPSIKKFSDADFPHWTGWQLINDDADNNSQCNSTIINGLRDNNLYDELKGRLICHFPFEWNKSTFDTRFSWLKTDSTEREPMPEADYDKLKAHMEALSIEPGEFPTGRVWHFEPRMFIEQSRKCGWLDCSVIKQIFTHDANSGSISIIEQKVSDYYQAINIIMNKYIMNTPLRRAHFLGQGAVESSCLKNMQEKSQFQFTNENGRRVGGRVNPNSLLDENTELGHWYGAIDSEYDEYYSGEKYNSNGGRIAGSYSWVIGNCGDVDAQKFRGRGFKQLTGRANYADYWVYRALISPNDFDANWWTDRQWQAHNVARMTLVPANIEQPNLVTRIKYTCIDTGGFFVVKTQSRRGVQSIIVRAMDGDTEIIHLDRARTNTNDEQVIRSVTSAINGGNNGILSRISFTRKAKKELI